MNLKQKKVGSQYCAADSQIKYPGVSMHTFPKEAERKQKWTTFARIHRLACQRNTLPCAPSILKHCVSAEMCLLGHKWISRGFTLRTFQYHLYMREAEEFIGH